MRWSLFCKNMSCGWSLSVSLIDLFIWTHSTIHSGLRNQVPTPLSVASGSCCQGRQQSGCVFLNVWMHKHPFFFLFLSLRAVALLSLVTRLWWWCIQNIISGHLDEKRKRAQQAERMNHGNQFKPTFFRCYSNLILLIHLIKGLLSFIFKYGILSFKNVCVKTGFCMCNCTFVNLCIEVAICKLCFVDLYILSSASKLTSCAAKILSHMCACELTDFWQVCYLVMLCTQGVAKERGQGLQLL